MPAGRSLCGREADNGPNPALWVCHVATVFARVVTVTEERQADHPGSSRWAQQNQLVSKVGRRWGGGSELPCEARPESLGAGGRDHKPRCVGTSWKLGALLAGTRAPSVL